MKITQSKWTNNNGWSIINDGNNSKSSNLVLVFGSTKLIKDQKLFDEIKEKHPNATIASCSTAGEIADSTVSDNTLSVTAITFEDTTIKTAIETINNPDESLSIGQKLGNALPKEDLVHVIVLSEGLTINGTNLVEGINKELPKDVVVTGGLSGDGSNFKETVVGLNGPGESNKIVVIGLYGSKLRVGYGSLGGWDTFGPKRLITKAKGNVLFELDHKPALALYKNYLGEQAKDLPASGLLFPLRIDTDSKTELVRTILSVNEENQSLTFAGDIPEGKHAQLMRANFDKLIDGASGAAKMSTQNIEGNSPELAILISCVGRKLVLKQRVDEEVENVRKTIGEDTILTGFYSYGEICPVSATSKQCQLHNQTMTITTLSEKK